MLLYNIDVFCRFLNQISERERYSNVTSNFICDKRLYPKAKRKVARCHLHMTEMQPFTYTFRVTSLQNMRDQHMWVSIFMCPQHSTFTRVERLSCGMAIILSSMFANIMYYEVSSSAYDEIIFDEFTIHLDHVAISIESAFVVVPVNALIVLIFVWYRHFLYHLRLVEPTLQERGVDIIVCHVNLRRRICYPAYQSSCGCHNYDITFKSSCHAHLRSQET